MIDKMDKSTELLYSIFKDTFRDIRVWKDPNHGMEFLQVMVSHELSTEQRTRCYELLNNACIVNITNGIVRVYDYDVGKIKALFNAPIVSYVVAYWRDEINKLLTEDNAYYVMTGKERPVYLTVKRGNGTASLITSRNEFLTRYPFVNDFPANIRSVLIRDNHSHPIRFEEMCYADIRALHGIGPKKAATLIELLGQVGITIAESRGEETYDGEYVIDTHVVYTKYKVKHNANGTVSYILVS